MLIEVKKQEGFATDLEPWLEAIRSRAQWAVPSRITSPVCRDPKDDIMIEAALAGRAQTTIARDSDLTVLEKPFGISILTPRQWLARLPRALRHQLKD